MSRDLKEMKEQPCRYGGEKIFQAEVRASAKALGQVLIPLRHSRRLKAGEPGEWVEAQEVKTGHAGRCGGSHGPCEHSVTLVGLF